MSEVKTCRSCGLENSPGRDFCERCGEYLSWAPTAYVAAVQKPGAAAADEEAATSGPAAGAAQDAATAKLGAADEGGGPAAPAPAPAAPDADRHHAARGHDASVHDPAPAGGAAAADTRSESADNAAAASTPQSADNAAAAPTPQSADNAAAAPTPKRADNAAAAPTPEFADDAGAAPGGASAMAGAGLGDVPLPPPSAPAVVGLPEGPPPSGDASIFLSPADPRLGTAGVPAVEAGSTLSFVATIRNESQIVDNYDLAVLGLPESWAVVAPTAAFLVPLGSGRGESDLELRVDISPPREYRSTAGIWTFELVALSRTTATIAARAIAQFEVKPFQAWSVEVVPVVNTGRLKARYRAAVRNDGNAEQNLWLVAITDSGKVRTKFQHGKLTLQAGEVGVDVLSVRPRFPLPVGRTIEHRIGIDALPEAPPVDDEQLTVKEKLAAKAKEEGRKTAGGVKVSSKGVTLPKLKLPRFRNPLAKLKLDASTLARLRGGGDANAPVTARQIVFRQKPVIPIWLIVAIIVLAVAAYLLYTLLPKKVDVPDLSGAKDSFVAEKQLRAEGLVLSQPVQRRVDQNAEAGSVVEQSPSAGARVEKGDAVSIVVADGQTKVSVPRLKDLTRVKADERLRQDGLELGDTQPATAADNWVVRSQIPDAGLSVDRGTSVRAFLKKPVAKKGKAKSKSGAGAAGGGGAGGGGGKATITIPPVKDMLAPEYSAALTKLKLKPQVRSAIADSPANTVLSVDPQPGEKAKKGDEVTVRASAGSPPLAVETEGIVQLLDPEGKEVGQLPDGDGTATQPSYFPDGKQVVYRTEGNDIVVSGTGKEPKKRTIYSGPDVLERPSVAPNGVIAAVIRREEGDGDLCFGRLDRKDIEHLCLPDDGWDVTGRPSWRKDGKVLLVAARKSGDAAVFGVRQYLTSRAFSTDPLLWKGRVVTDVSSPRKGVLAAEYSPDGKQIAFITNLESNPFEVVLAAAKDLELVEPQPTGTNACDVAWRPDGKELVVVQADDECAEPLGKVLRFAPGKPRDTTLVSDEGHNPTYQPVG